MNRSLIVSHSTSNKEEILAAERRVKSKFSAGFLDFFTRYNGAKIKRSEIKSNNTTSKQISYEINAFFLIDEVGQPNVESWDNCLVAFAEDSSGNYFVLKKPSLKEVYFWDHETNDIELVASEFEDFISRIQETDLSQVQIPDDATGWIDSEFLASIKKK